MPEPNQPDQPNRSADETEKTHLIPDPQEDSDPESKNPESDSAAAHVGDQTIEIDQSQEDSVGIDQTIEFDSQDSVAPVVPSPEDPKGTVVEDESEDVSATIEFDSQESFDGVKIETGPDASEQDESADIGATMEFDPEQSAGSLTLDSKTLESPVKPEDPKESDSQKTVSDRSVKTHEIQTVDLGNSDSDSNYPTMHFDSGFQSGVQDNSDDLKATIDPDSSVLNGNKITRTLDARSMSDSDQRIWGMTTDFEVEEKGKSGAEPLVKRDDITESKLLVPERQLAGLDRQIKIDSDYELIEVLGEGGMGTVYLAKQTSLDRLVALKMVKPLAGEKAEQLRTSGKLSKTERNRRDQFLAEAIVTGDLDHPNIVPIHDLAVAGDNALFYAMKKVDGTPWSDVIADKSLDENLEILLKVCDAMGFAHARGIVHRDIKPENVMLGEYGVVLLMDWGLAVPKPNFQKRGSIHTTMSLGGSPAYMAPEMATGPLEDIGAGSDIYLLGAVLFEIITGRPPHIGNNLTQCLRAAAVNKIVDVSSRHDGELMQIARKAMATKPSRRYSSVGDLQKAIREYRSHAESILMTVRADADLRKAKESADYTDYARTTFGYEEALTLWSGNKVARLGLDKARIAYAETALNKEDYELGLSLLDESNEDHQPLVHTLRAGQVERDSRLSRLKAAKKIGVGLVAVILLGGSAALFIINQEKERAKTAEKEAVKAKVEAVMARDDAVAAQLAEEVARLEAEAATDRAIEARDAAEMAQLAEKVAKEDAVKARDAAVAAQLKEKAAREAEEEAKNEAVAAQLKEKAAKEEAVKARDDAVEAQLAEKAAKEEAENQRGIAQKQRSIAMYEAYVAQIGLAKARIDQNEFDDARRILEGLREQAKESESNTQLGWEWQWLWHQATQAKSAEELDTAGQDLAVGASGKIALVTLEDGTAQVIQIDEQGNARRDSSENLPSTTQFTATAISPSERLIATAGIDGLIRIWDRENRLWMATMEGHSGAITSLVFINEYQLLSSSTDRTARLWDVQDGQQLAACWHISAVRDVAVCHDSTKTLIATAVADDHAGKVVLWRLGDNGEKIVFTKVGDFQEHDAPVHAVTLSSDGQLAASGDRSGRVLTWRTDEAKPIDYGSRITAAVKALSSSTAAKPLQADAQPFVELRTTTTNPDTRLRIGEPELPLAHRDAIESLQFNEQGTRLLSTSDDYTIKLWDLASYEVTKTLRGHGGWVRDAQFLPQSGGMILSIGNDASVRSWNPKSYLDVVTLQNPIAGTRESTAHDDEIWAASFDAQGTRIVTASRDHTARVIEIDPVTLTFKDSKELADEEGQLNEGSQFVALSIAMDTPRNRIFVGSADSTVRVWNTNTGSEISNARGTGLNTTLAVAPNGQFLVTGSSDEEARILVWAINEKGVIQKTPRYRLGIHESSVTAIDISPDSQTIYTGDRNGIGILWNSQTGEVIGEPLNQHQGFRINAAKFSPDGSELYVAADDQKLSRINTASQNLVEIYPHEGFVTSVALSPAGRHVATLTETSVDGSLTSSVILWDLENGDRSVLDRAVRASKSASGSSTQSQRFVSLRFSEQGQLLTGVSRKLGSLVKVWTLQGEQPELDLVLQMPDRLSDLVDALPARDGQLLTLNGDSTFLWDLQSLNHIRSFRAHGGVTEADFSFDSKYVVTGSRSLKVWNLETGKSLQKVEVPHEGSVRSVQFSPKKNEYVIASAGDDGSVKLWNWDPELKSISEIRELSFASDGKAVHRLRFSPTGRYLLAVGEGGKGVLWDLNANTSGNVFQVDENEDALLCGAFSEDERWIAVGGADRLARIWRVSEQGKIADAPDRVLRGHADIVEDIGFLNDQFQQYRVMTASRDKSARIWDPRLSGSGNEGREILAFRKHSLGLTAVDATRSGNLLMTAGRDGLVVLWPAGVAPQTQP